MRGKIETGCAIDPLEQGPDQAIAEYCQGLPGMRRSGTGQVDREPKRVIIQRQAQQMGNFMAGICDDDAAHAPMADHLGAADRAGTVAF